MIVKMSRKELEAMTTKRLNSLRKAIYKCGKCLEHSDRSCYHPSIDLVKEVLSTREHIPK